MASTKSIAVDIPTGPDTKTFKLTKKHLLGNYGLRQDGPDPQEYYIVASYFKTMDITLYAGTDRKSSPPIGAGRIASISRDHKLGYSPASSPGGKEDFAWEDMRREKLTEWGYAFGFTIPATRERAALMWKRTSHVSVAGMKTNWMSGRNFKLVDRTDENKVLAVFTAVTGWSSCGALQINVDWGVEFERIVVVSCVTLYEKVSREHAGDSADTPG